MKRSILAGISLLCFLTLASCKNTTSVASFSVSETECLGVELDGSQTVRAWGTGRDKADAVEQARKNAVYDILFKGIRGGVGGCAVRPLLTEVNAAERHERYFNAFFKDRGEYRKYASQKDERSGSKISESNQSQVKYGVVVRVLRSELKEKLIQDGIIKE
ncbi:MAG: hypothetical protein LBQ78_05585 [Tannerellaceae bacterium]|nr:hypothetical protein [Tannerellaceae bacterium]